MLRRQQGGRRSAPACTHHNRQHQPTGPPLSTGQVTTPHKAKDFQADVDRAIASGIGAVHR
eukprot:8565475-Prorocentrum_lima.AAC.1